MKKDLPCAQKKLLSVKMELIAKTCRMDMGHSKNNKGI